MSRSPHLLLVFSLLATGLATGCKPKSAGSGSPAGYFATPFQSESQFIVETIVSDLAEQMSYATSQRLPDKKRFLVTATEKPGSPLDSPVDEVAVRLAPNQRGLKTEVSIKGPIWSPAVYEALAGELARAVGLSGNHPGKPDDTALLSKLIDNTAETIEDQNQAISAALEKDFRNPDLHEAAAMLLGAFMLRENSGNFYEIRSPLSRMTAHLAMAQFLRGTGTRSMNGRMAEAVLLTLMNDQSLALACLKAIATNDAAVAAMARALRTVNTGDYRPLEQVTNSSPIESAARFSNAAF